MKKTKQKTKKQNNVNNAIHALVLLFSKFSMAQEK